MEREYSDIPGTVVFDGAVSSKGYSINMFLYSLREETNRAEFGRNERAYTERYGLSARQTDAILTRDWNAILENGGNIYYICKLAATDGLPYEGLYAQMCSLDRSSYRAMMLEGGRPPVENRKISRGGAAHD